MLYVDLIVYVLSGVVQFTVVVNNLLFLYLEYFLFVIYIVVALPSFLSLLTPNLPHFQDVVQRIECIVSCLQYHVVIWAFLAFACLIVIRKSERCVQLDEHDRSNKINRQCAGTILR